MSLCLLYMYICLILGFLLEGVTPTAPPDVPPRNPTMNRMNNGRLVAANPNDLGVDFEPSCLVRTPSGNVYIPSDNLINETLLLNNIKVNMPKACSSCNLFFMFDYCQFWQTVHPAFADH
uniref:Uncharacterized protein n=1 Tax=Glossina palpalis gambiensis TaxID=67801 RepID=A0A1B0AYF4_9MUSC